MKRMSLSAAVIGAITLASCSDRDRAPAAPQSSEMTPSDEGGNPSGRVVGFAYGEMSSRAVVLRENRSGAMTVCFWSVSPNHSSPMGCAQLE
jgi:hypothetical protein